VPCGSVCETKVLEECAASMFRLENGGSRFFSKCWYLYVSTTLYIMTAKIFIIMRVLPVLNFFCQSYSIRNCDFITIWDLDTGVYFRITYRELQKSLYTPCLTIMAVSGDFCITL